MILLGKKTVGGIKFYLKDFCEFCLVLHICRRQNQPREAGKFHGD